MRQRINITLPEETLRMLDGVSGKGNRSRFIDEAVKRFVQEVSQRTLRQRLKEGAIKRASRDRQLAADWFDVEEEAWSENKK